MPGNLNLTPHSRVRLLDGTPVKVLRAVGGGDYVVKLPGGGTYGVRSENLVDVDAEEKRDAARRTQEEAARAQSAAPAPEAPPAQPA